MKVIYKTKIDEIKTVTTTKDEGLIKSIDCDMKITYVHELTETGYGTEYDFDLINIKEKKAYLVNDFDIWGNEKDPAKKGHNFTITPINLTDNDINMLKQLSNEQTKEYLKTTTDREYLKVEYNGRTIYLDSINIQYQNK